MNRKNNEGFTPLLYASYSGHMEVIKYLFEEHKVNQKLVTNSGLNPLHLAAQKNKVLPFLYFRDYFKIVEEDNAKSTPLHWAACTNS
jgi:ankyrin repeat protein